MNSLYLHNIFNNNSFTLNDIKYKKYKYYFIPFIGLLEKNKRYSIPKKIFMESKIFYGNNKIIKINDLLFIQINNNIFNRKKWYINTIKNIIKTYEKIFKYKIKFPIFVQINEYKKHNSKMFIGGFASYQGIELILYKNIKQHNNKNNIKWILSHELLHLFFPPIKSKYSTCWNEGFVDYLSLILNFSQKEIQILFNKKLKEYRYIKSLNNKKYVKQENPYIRGFLYGFLMNKLNIKKTLSFIQQYLRERKYLIIPWINKEYYLFVKNNLFINKFCEQHIEYDI